MTALDILMGLPQKKPHNLACFIGCQLSRFEKWALNESPFTYSFPIPSDHLSKPNYVSPLLWVQNKGDVLNLTLITQMFSVLFFNFFSFQTFLYLQAFPLKRV